LTRASWNTKYSFRAVSKFESYTKIRNGTLFNLQKDSTVTVGVVNRNTLKLSILTSTVTHWSYLLLTWSGNDGEGFSPGVNRRQLLHKMISRWCSTRQSRTDISREERESLAIWSPDFGSCEVIGRLYLQNVIRIHSHVEHNLQTRETILILHSSLSIHPACSAPSAYVNDANIPAWNVAFVWPHRLLTFSLSDWLKAPREVVIGCTNI